MIELSVVVPYYRKLADFRRVLPFNVRFLARPDVELVLVLDEPSEQAEALAVVDQFPFLQARVLVNDRPHPWRPPGEAINVGLRHAEGERVMVLSPETLMVGDVVSRAIEVLRAHPRDVVLGRMAWATFADVQGKFVPRLFEDRFGQQRLRSYNQHYYGSLAASRDLLLEVGGWQEGLTHWGGDDDNVRVRLAMHGALLVLDRKLAFFHLSDAARKGHEPTAPRHSPEQALALLLPKSARANPEGFGEAFGRVARDWRAALELPPLVRVDDPAALTEAPPVRRRLVWGTTARGVGRSPKVVAIFSYRFDAHLVAGLIENLEPAVDAWIAVDDRASTDVFSDELERRRILVLQAQAMGAEWIFAADPDERFETGLAGCIDEVIAGPRARVRWTFLMRDLYEPNRYRVDGHWGKKATPRLFPLLPDVSVGGRRLHSNWCEHYPLRPTGLNLYHLKMLTPERRRARRDLYKGLDPDAVLQPGGYDHLADDNGAVLEEIPPGRGFNPPYQEDGGLWMATI